MRFQHYRLYALAGLSALLIGGCVTPKEPLYYWGGYQNTVYGHFNGEMAPEQQILEMEKAREEARAKNKPLPPGFQAHLGLLYGETGRSDQLVINLLAEKNQYPESAAYVDFLLKKTQKPTATKGKS